MRSLDIFQKKAVQREEGKKRRNSIKDKTLKDSAILEYTLSFPPVVRSKTLHIYISFGSECKTEGIINFLIQMEKKVVVPVVDKKNKKLLFSALESFDRSTMKTTDMGISEPSARENITDPHEVDVAIIPGIAFDSKGGRIGYGGGYYDRIISYMTKENTKSSGVIIAALAYYDQIIEDVLMTKHDQRVDFIISEHGIIRCSKV